MTAAGNRAKKNHVNVGFFMSGRCERVWTFDPFFPKEVNVLGLLISTRAHSWNY